MTVLDEEIRGNGGLYFDRWGKEGAKRKLCFEGLRRDPEVCFELGARKSSQDPDRFEFYLAPYQNTPAAPDMSHAQLIPTNDNWDDIIKALHDLGPRNASATRVWLREHDLESFIESTAASERTQPLTGN